MIQPLKADDKSLDTLLSWIDSAETLMQFAGPAFSYPLTKRQLQDSLSDPNRYAFQYVLPDTGEMVGYAEVCLTGESAKLGRILIGHTAARGQGYGSQIVQHLVRIAFDELEQQTAELNVFDWNANAIHVYEKAGFVLNPKKKLERAVNGKVWIAVNMVLDKEDWKP